MDVESRFHPQFNSSIDGSPRCRSLPQAPAAKATFTTGPTISNKHWARFPQLAIISNSLYISPTSRRARARIDIAVFALSPGVNNFTSAMVRTTVRVTASPKSAFAQRAHSSA